MPRGGSRSARRLRLFRAAQCWDAEELSRYRDARVAALVDHAYRTTSFYRRRMDEAGVRPEHVRGVADLGRMPVLTRADLSEHAAELVSSAVPARDPRVGQLERVHRAARALLPRRDSLAAGIATERLGWEMAGWRAGDRSALVWGNPGHRRGGMDAAGPADEDAVSSGSCRIPALHR